MRDAIEFFLLMDWPIVLPWVGVTLAGCCFSFWVRRLRQ